MRAGLPQPGTLILGPEKPGANLPLLVCVPAEGTVHAEGGGRTGRNSAPSALTLQGAGPSPHSWHRGFLAGPGLDRAGPGWTGLALLDVTRAGSVPFGNLP